MMYLLLSFMFQQLSARNSMKSLFCVAVMWAALCGLAWAGEAAIPTPAPGSRRNRAGRTDNPS